MKNVFKLLGIVCIACSLLAGKCGKKDEVATYKITVKANPSEAGTVTGAGKYESGASATLEAVANAGYNFVEWNDGNKNNPRIVTVTADAEYVANFAVQSGVKVNFGTNTWNAGYMNGQCKASAYMIAAAQTNMESYPYLVLFNLAGGPAVGTANGDDQISDEGANHGNVYLDYYENPERAVSLGDQSVGDWWGMNLVINVTAFDADNLAISLVANAEMWNVAAIPYDNASASNLPKKNLSMTASSVELTQVKSILSRNVAGKITRK